MCQLGCIGPGPDPYPEEPGAWLGLEFTDDMCIGGGNDNDFDGVTDLCELRLAEAFAPRMIVTNGLGENVNGEWYWAVRSTSSSSVLILYLPAYYEDLGKATFPVHADSHHGDSEAIALEATYNAATGHWLLVEANYSQHGGYQTFDSPGNGFPYLLNYSERDGSFPDVWVSKYKHANYANAYDCNTGGAFGFDVCVSPQNTVATRFPIYENHNLGSNSYRFKNCVQSEFDYSRLGTECFWLNVPSSFYTFDGWIYSYDHTNGSNNHAARLVDFGFIP